MAITVQPNAWGFGGARPVYMPWWRYNFHYGTFCQYFPMRSITWNLNASSLVSDGHSQSAYSGVPHSQMDAAWLQATKEASADFAAKYPDAQQWSVVPFGSTSDTINPLLMGLERGLYTDTSLKTFRQLDEPWEREAQPLAQTLGAYSFGAAESAWGTSMPFVPGSARTVYAQASLHYRVQVYLMPLHAMRSSMNEIYKIDEADRTLDNFTAALPNKVLGYAESRTLASWFKKSEKLWYYNVDWVKKSWSPSPVSLVWGWSRPAWGRLENWFDRGAFFASERNTDAHDVFYPVLQDIIDGNYSILDQWLPDFALTASESPWSVRETNEGQFFRSLFDERINNQSGNEDWLFWIALIPPSIPTGITNFWNNRPRAAQEPLPLPYQPDDINFALNYFSQSMAEKGYPLTSAKLFSLTMQDEDEKLLYDSAQDLARYTS